MKRVKIIIEGDIQKKGYREFISELAKSSGVVGYVKNINEGVEIVGEGEEESLVEFVELVKIKRSAFPIKEITSNFEEPKNEFNKFEIKYGGILEELKEWIGANTFQIKEIMRKERAKEKEEKKRYTTLKN